MFCYGTLMARVRVQPELGQQLRPTSKLLCTTQEVTTALLGHLPAFEPATLKGHKRYGIKGQVFPAIVVGDDADVVQGVVRGCRLTLLAALPAEWPDHAQCASGVRGPESARHGHL